jgi:hypothetical protein
MVATQILAKVESSRLQKAVEGLVSGAYEVTVARREKEYVAGYVKNGTEYAVTLTEGLATCSCPDSMYRHITCKHQALFALWLVRHPVEEHSAEERKPDLSLAKVRKGFAFSA